LQAEDEMGFGQRKVYRREGTIPYHRFGINSKLFSSSLFR
jgi:hypothetical protein